MFEYVRSLKQIGQLGLNENECCETEKTLLYGK